jgi:cyclopropane-fatty-acyl-phospholipid synthase
VIEIPGIGVEQAGTGGLPLTVRLTFAVLSRLRVGTLHVRWVDGSEHTFRGGTPGPEASVIVTDPRLTIRLLAAGEMGLGESYMDGMWETPDLGAVLDLGCANIMMQDDRPHLRSPLDPIQKLVHLTRPNTQRGAKRNIAAHYDLGNDFYRLWLDETMTYSSARFDGEALDLAGAQRRKWDSLLDMLGADAGEHILEIGCGWGGFAVHAARTRGCRVTGITISEEQHGYARELAQASGVSTLVDIRLQDYRDVRGVFDHVASIEMFEAVGERWWPTLFGVVRDRLRRGGTAALQVITIRDRVFEAYRRAPDFTQRYIFPGGMVPSPSAFAQGARAAGLAEVAVERFGQDYARTLETWLDRFDDSTADIARLGFDERFCRMWRYYLAYCAAGFRAGNIDAMQVALRHA